MAVGDDAAAARGEFSDTPAGEPIRMCGAGAAFDPIYTVTAMPADLVQDARGVFGYMPTPGTEFANTEKWPDWTDPEAVAKANATRVEYHKGLAEKAQWVESLRAQGATDAAIGRQLVDMRNEARMAMYAPEDLPKLLERNMKVYKNPNGPSYEDALKKAGGDAGEVVAAALRSNKGVDVLCGVCKIVEPRK